MKQHSNQTVGQIRSNSLLKGIPCIRWSNQRQPLSFQISFCVTPHEWNIPDLAVCCTQIFRWNLFSKTLNYVFERWVIVFLKSGILEEFTFQGELCAWPGIYWQATSNWITNGQTNLIITVLTLHNRAFHSVHEF